MSIIMYIIFRQISCRYKIYVNVTVDLQQCKKNICCVSDHPVNVKLHLSSPFSSVLFSTKSCEKYQPLLPLNALSTGSIQGVYHRQMQLPAVGYIKRL